MTHPDIWLITGAREIGKTRFCSHVVEKAKTKQMNIKGIFCPPIYTNSKKTGISIQNIETNEIYKLAERCTEGTANLSECGWIFDQNLLSWGNNILAHSVPCELLLIDELGPLEFEQRKGWVEGLKAVDSLQYKTAIVVIRPELIEVAQQRWPEARILEIPANIDPAAEQFFIQKIFS